MESDKVAKIGKDLHEWDAVDTGFFVLDESIFEVTSALASEKESFELREVVEGAKLKVTFIDGLPQIDVDMPEDVKRARTRRR